MNGEVPGHSRWRRYALAVAVIGLLSGILLGWNAYRNAAARRAVEQSGGQLIEEQHVLPFSRWTGDIPFFRATSIVGVDFHDPQFSDAHLTGLVPSLQRFGKLTQLSFSWAGIGDSAMEAIVPLQNLTWLDASNTQVGDKGLRHVAKLKNLRILRLDGTPVTDAGLKHLDSLSRLELLNLDNTSVSDDGIQHLASLRHLQELNVSNTDVTDEGLNRLSGALPELMVWDD